MSDEQGKPPEAAGTQAPRTNVTPPLRRDGSSYLGTAPDSLLATLGIVVTEVTDDRVTATMPVTSVVHQPHGILHGGASVALAETVASIGASARLAPHERAVGLEINANHVRSVSDGTLTAVATPLHRGRRTHVWSVEIRDDSRKLVCVSRCTLAIIAAAA